MEYNRDWTFDVVGDVDEDFVSGVIDFYCPHCFSFNKYEGSTQPSYEKATDSKYGTYPVPKFDWHIIIFRRDDPAYSMQNAVGLGYKRRCVVSWVPWENEQVLGLRIWHEMLHSMGDAELNSDMMVKNDRVAFTNWLKNRYPSAVGDFETNYMAHEHDPNYQKYYYKMLTEKLFPPYANKPVVDFAGAPRNGNPPLTVAFADKTSGYCQTREWKVYGPDGMKLKNEQNPLFELTSTGSYRVALVVFDGFDTVYKDVKDYISVVSKTPSVWERFLAWIKQLLS